MAVGGRLRYIPAMTRFLDFEGVPNFRDYGGYATACGRGLKGARLYRSGHHNGATEADLEKLAGLGLAVVVDLRRAAEREREPSRRWPGFDAQLIQNDIGDVGRPWEEELQGADPTVEFFRTVSLGWYRRNPFEPRLIDLYSRYFAALAQTDGAVLVHCAAGKDRTGLLCALTHHLAGVHRDDLIEDFLLTNVAAAQATHAARVGALITRHTGRAPSDEALRVAMGVNAEDLQAAFQVMEARCGSLDGYLEGVLGVDAPRREAIAARLLG
jgi:protein tyrosine/serine phosphatase